MVRCTECGTRNEDDAKFCKNCGASLTGAPRDYGREIRKRADEDCKPPATRGSQIFWGIVIALVGAWVIFEFGIKNIPGVPAWVHEVAPWWIIPVVIGLGIIVVGIRWLAGKS